MTTAHHPRPMPEAQPMSAETFADRWLIIADVRKAPHQGRRPPWDPDGRWKGTHWRVRLVHMDGASFSLDYWTGEAITEKPTAADVLLSLAMDARGVAEGETFEQWAPEYGYDTDSRRAEQTYREVKSQSERVRAWLPTEQAWREFLAIEDE